MKQPSFLYLGRLFGFFFTVTSLRACQSHQKMRFCGHWTVEAQMATISYVGCFTGVMFLYQPARNALKKTKIPQIDDRFVLLDPVKMGNLMIPGVWTTIFYSKVKIHHPKGTTIFLMLADFQGLCSRISWNTLEVQLASIFHITGVLILPTQTTHYKGNPSKLPFIIYINIVWSPPNISNKVTPVLGVLWETSPSFCSKGCVLHHPRKPTIQGTLQEPMHLNLVLRPFFLQYDSLAPKWDHFPKNVAQNWWMTH